MSGKKRWYSKLFLLSVAILIVSIPLNIFINNWTILTVINIVLKCISLAFIIVYSKKERFEQFEFNKPKQLDLLLIPFLLITISNLIVVFIDNKTSPMSIPSFIYIFLSIISIGLTAIIEEIIFRHYIYKEFTKTQSKLKAIIFTSMIFGGMHLLNINSLSSIPYCLVQSVYTFGIGLILSIVYLFSRNIIYPITLHFLFNFINDALVTSIFNIEWNFVFFIVNIIIGVLIGLYSLFIYKNYLIEEVFEYVS